MFSNHQDHCSITHFFFCFKITSIFNNKVLSFSRVLYFSFPIGTAAKVFEITDPLIKPKQMIYTRGWVG